MEIEEALYLIKAEAMKRDLQFKDAPASYRKGKDDPTTQAGFQFMMIKALNVAIEALETIKNGVVPMDFHDRAMAIQYERLRAPQRWIPVSERLPDGDVASVIIHTKAGGVAEGQYYPSIKAWKQFRWSVEDANVTHWMPLPSIPSEDKI